jgi:DNA invertase Pin-like site-specific DNA recombinase
MKIGFARCSTKKQSLTAQIQALEEEGCEEIYSEKVSGAASLSKRPELENMLRAVRKNDVICSTKIDRLARSSLQLYKIAAELKEKGCHLKFLDQSIDTTTPEGELLFGILGHLAQFELSLIRSRTQEGLERAKENGVKVGRKGKTTKSQDRQIIQLWKSGESSWGEIAKTYGISRQAVYNRIKKYRDEHAEKEIGGRAACVVTEK